MRTRRFLYLSEEAHAKTWIEGGEIPINPASHYYNVDLRGGVMTPDENRIYRNTGVPTEIEGLIKIGRPAVVPASSSNRGLVVTFDNCTFGSPGLGVTRFSGEIEGKVEDVLILCFSRVLSPSTGRAFGGRNVVVEIINLPLLVRSLNDALGASAEVGWVEYTSGTDRNHFLKSELDRWQAEYRLIWRVDPVEQRWVPIPPGIGRRVNLPPDWLERDG